jgi:RNA polymerase sigma-54 factor
MGAIAGGKDAGVGRLQRRANGDMAVSQVKSGVGEPGKGHGTADGNGQIGGKAGAIGKDDGIRLYLCDRLAFAQINASPRKRRPHFALGFWGQGTQGLSGLDNRDLGSMLAQAVGCRQGNLGAADTATNDDDFAARLGCRKKAVPACQERIKRANGHCIVDTINKGRPSLNADVERGNVIAQRRTTGDVDGLGHAVDASDGAKHKTRVGKAAEAHKVDHRFIAVIVSGDNAGQHAGIGGNRRGIDKGQLHTGLWLHGPFAQDKRVGMATAHKDKIAHKGKVSLHACCLRRLRQARKVRGWFSRRRMLRSVAGMSTRPRLNVTATQRMALNTGLVTAINTLRSDALGLTRYLEEAAATNPALILQLPPLQPHEWLPRWVQAFAGASREDQVASVGPSLMAHVAGFAARTFRGAQDRAIALAIAEALEPSGWLGRPISAIAAEVGCTQSDALRVLAALQQIEPRGLFAQSLSECLRLQAEEAGVADAVMRVMLDNLDLLAVADLGRLARLARTTEAEIARRLRVIRSFDPKPGAAFSQAAALVREPDLLAEKQDDGWRIALNVAALPSVALSDDRKAGRRAEARAVMAMVKARNDTLLRVGREVLVRQWRALEAGLGQAVPLRMADVAAGLGLHESTVSRVVAGTAVDTPQGTWWLRDLFSGDLGDGVSAVAMRARLQALVAEEDASKPLSDAALAAALSGDGVEVARRTVAKYRMLLRIPSAHARRLKSGRKRRPKG